jgi:hypothetical protein
MLPVLVCERYFGTRLHEQLHHRLLQKRFPNSSSIEGFTEPEPFLLIQWEPVELQNVDLPSPLATVRKPEPRQTGLNSACMWLFITVMDIITLFLHPLLFAHAQWTRQIPTA